MDPTTPEEVVKRVQHTPISKWLHTIIGLVLGSIAALWLSIKWDGREAMLIVAAIMLLWPAYTFYIVYPDVLWVPLAMTLGILIPGVLNYRAGDPTKSRHSEAFLS